uniref:STI1 domain-containing protein n=1 Tax=Hemiselmis andersenii TaxID=464988 RepID=A0A6U4WCQ4_HEMAN|mmetsp:Transcript_31157/g.75957  ORF Transcript_31157/g.75957 Transcript_31157/m.75957 type:complete len:317 (-) Transcript_31157:199-1149(-)
MGNDKYKAKDFAGAMSHYQKAHTLDPTNMVYMNNIAAVLFAEGKYQECVDQVEKALEVGKEHRAAFTDLGKAYSRLGNALVKLERLEEAVKAYDSSLMEVKDGQVELKRRTAIRMKEDRDEKAYLDPEKAEEERQKGNQLFKEGKWVDAISAYTEGIKRDPTNHLLYSNRGQTYIKVMDLGSALKDCDKCIQLKPDFPRAYARKANVQLLCKQAHKAKETVEEGLAQCPGDAELKQVGAKVQQSIMGVGLSQEEREARAQEAMKDPAIVNIMQDPVMRDVLNEMQTNPAAAQKHMMNPDIARKVETLIAAGIIQTR